MRWWLLAIVHCCSAGAQRDSRRVVLTLRAPLNDTGALTLGNATLVKKYGRRLVWDLGRPVDLERDAPSILGAWNASRLAAVLEAVEVDTLVGNMQTIYNPVVERADFSSAIPGVEWHFSDAETYSLRMERVWQDIAALWPNESRRIPVAVLDAGLAALPASYFEGLAPGYDFVTDVQLSLDGDGRDPDATDPGDAGCGAESSWHGTKMAAAMCLRHGAVDGVHSMLPGGVLALQPLRVLGECSMGYANDVTDAIVWAAGGTINGLGLNPRPAKVISMSFTGQGPCPSFLQSAVSLALSRGCTLMAAAGNQGQDSQEFFPGNCQGVQRVGASTRGGDLAAYSNVGPDVAAPGGDLSDPIRTVHVAASELVPAWGMGSSFSTAFAVALAALDAWLVALCAAEPLRHSLTPFSWDAARCFSGACGPGIASGYSYIQDVCGPNASLRVRQAPRYCCRWGAREGR